MKNIKLSDIQPCPWNTRGEITPESVKELAASIEAQGLINPITLWESPDGAVYCIAGNRRLAALRALHTKDFDGELPKDHYNVFGGDEQEARMVTVTENLQREDVGIVEEAELVKQCLDGGMSIAEVAAHTGRGEAWVRRRAKIAALDASWADFAKNHPDAITADAVERIACYPEKVQKAVFKGLKPNAGGKYGWASIKWQFERESFDLDGCAMMRDATVCAACKACQKRTGVEADLFGDADGKLGYCMDAECYRKTRERYEAAAIKAACGDAETVTCHSHWQVPDAATGEKKSKRNPCAYTYFDNDGELKVKWGPSKAEAEKREAEEAEERNAKSEADRARRERINAIGGKLNEYFNDYNDANEAPIADKADEIVRGYAKASEDAREFVVDAVVDKLTEWRSNHEWASALRTFGWMAEMAGVGEADAEFLMNEFPEKEDENETEED